jgi:hypothetical protein
MKQVQIVSPNFVNQIWHKIEHFFEKSFKVSTDDCTLEQLRFILVQGHQTLFIILEDEKIIGTCTVEIINYPNNRVVHMTTLNGAGLVEESVINQFEDWCKAQGATKIRAFAQDTQARLYKMKMGLDMVTHVVEKKI